MNDPVQSLPPAGKPCGDVDGARARAGGHGGVANSCVGPGGGLRRDRDPVHESRQPPQDGLLRTAWEYLTSGAVIRIMAAAFIIAGVAGMIGRRPSVAVIGLLAGAVTAFVPTILGALISQNTATALQICG